jgi:hypothetical protein
VGLPDERELIGDPDLVHGTRSAHFGLIRVASILRGEREGSHPRLIVLVGCGGDVFNGSDSG